MRGRIAVAAAAWPGEETGGPPALMKRLDFAWHICGEITGSCISKEGTVLHGFFCAQARPGMAGLLPKCEGLDSSCVSRMLLVWLVFL